MRTLRVSHNDLGELDISNLPRLRTLYADNNRLRSIGRSTGYGSSRLENLSIRNQGVNNL